MTPEARALADEGAALEILELEDRVRDLEGERDTYREMVQVLLAEHHKRTGELDRLRESNRELRELLRDDRAEQKAA